MRFGLRHRLKNWRNPHNQTQLHLSKFAERYGWSIGEFSYGRPKVRFPEAGATLTIGRYCSFADKVEILLGGNHRVDWATTYPFSAQRPLWPAAPKSRDYHGTRGDVTIGNDVWIGSGAMILSGVTIGDGAVIGARAVVVRDVPPYGIVGGNPATLIRLRFDAASVRDLLDIAWWDLPPDIVGGLIPLLQSDRIADLVARVRELRAGAP
jgi:acetyltransferase-like isoleucine patch superfamily enzyme